MLITFLTYYVTIRWNIQDLTSESAAIRSYVFQLLNVVKVTNDAFLKQNSLRLPFSVFQIEFFLNFFDVASLF